MIPANALVSLFQLMHREHWSYVWGKAEKGCVDCSGAFVYAYRQYGLSIAHGSNAIARKYIVGKMLPISEAKPGMAAFKVKVPGEEGYDLPDKYKSGDDPNDYYHIGLVDDDPKYVLNAKGTNYGFCRDRLSRETGWDCVAYLKDVDYAEGADKVEKDAIVVLPSGKTGTTVNMRVSPGGDLLMRVPVGTTVKIVEDAGEWCLINYNGNSGWMMSNYLEYVSEGDETGDYDTIRKALSELSKLANEIVTQVGTIEALINR